MGIGGYENWRVWELEGMRTGGYEGFLSPEILQNFEWNCPKLNWNECIGNVIRKAKIVGELEMNINKKFDLYF